MKKKQKIFYKIFLKIIKYKKLKKNKISKNWLKKKKKILFLNNQKFKVIDLDQLLN